MAQLDALTKGFRHVDAERSVRAMNIARVAFHASKSEVAAWSAAQVYGREPRHAAEDLRAGWRASLEALGIPVEE